MARQRRASAWMFVIVSAIAAAVVVLAMLAVARHGLPAFLSGGG